MQDVLNFVTDVLGLIPAFLMSDPIRYFVGIFVLFGIIGLVLRICRISL